MINKKFGQNLKQSEFEYMLSDLQSKYDNLCKNLSNACANPYALESLQSEQSLKNPQTP